MEQTSFISKLDKYIGSWSSGNAFVSGAAGPRFKTQAGQFGPSVTNVSPPL